MTTKYLNGYNPDPYLLKAKYSKLVIDLGCSVGYAFTSNYAVASYHTATIINYGTVGGQGIFQSYRGVYLEAGGRLTNGSATDKTALIAGGYNGNAVVLANGLSATVTNFGTIESSWLNSQGVLLGQGGSVTNGSAADTIALIEAGLGVYSEAGVVTTLTNFGTIDGTGGDAVFFHDAADRLIVEKSAVFDGALGGGGGTLELAGGSDTITGLGGAGKMTGATSAGFYGFGTYVVDTGAELTLTGANALTAGQSLRVAGALVNTGTLTGPATSGYGVTLLGGTLTNGSATDTTALIAGDRSGVYATVGTTVTIGNFGTIQASSASNSVGVNLDANGSVTNGSAADTIALIKGGIGVYSYGAAVTTVTNFGTIDGTGGTAVDFHDAADRLIVESKAVFDGALGGGDGTLELAGGSDTITGLGGAGEMTGATPASFSGFGSYVVDTGAELTLTGANALTAGQSLRVAGALVNTGTLTGPATSGYGVTLLGGTLTNGSATDTTALIAGDRSGVYATVGTTVTIGNFGTIQASSASNSVGVNLDANGSVTNGSAADTIALIKGGIGVYSYGAAVTTLTNFGTIDGTGGTAVDFHDAADRLIVEKNAVFDGALDGGDGTLELAGGSDTITGLGGTGTVSGAGPMTFTDFGSYQLDAGGSRTLTGTNSLAGDQSLVVSGTLTDEGALTNAGVISGGGTLALAGGTATFAAGASLTIAKVDESGAATLASFDAPSLTYAKVWDQTAGTVSVSSGDRVNFTGVGDVFDGALSGAGTIALTGGSDSLTGATLSAKSVIVNGPTVIFGGTIDLTGALTGTSQGLIIAAGGATFSGGGTFVLTDAASNMLSGTTAAATLTNEDLIRGAGDLGGGAMMLVNAASGSIDGDNTVALTLDTGANAIANAGLIENTGSGGTTIKSAIVNTGTLDVTKGTLTTDGAVTGTGRVWISGGTADFASSFSQSVIFKPGSTGTLELAQSQAFKGAVSGFSTTGATTLDLGDIGFVSSSEATFVENAAKTRGVLTVTDGTHTANITLVGDYSTSTFTASSDGHGGTRIVDPVKAALQTNSFAAAMAGMGVSHAAASPGTDFWRTPAPSLAMPRAQFA